MTLAYRAGSFVSAGNASGGNLTLTKPTGTVDGDRVVINVYFEPDTTTITVSGGPWESVTIANTGAFKTQCFTKIASSEPASYTISNDTPGNQWRAASGVAYSGGTGSGTQIDTSATAQGDGQIESNQTAPSIDPTSTNTMVVFAYGNFNGADPTAVAGFCTNLRGSLGSAAIADALNATGAATGTSRPNGGAGTQDYAALHVALISDIGGMAYTLNLATGAYSLSGQALTLQAARLVSLAAAAYSVSGQALTFQSARIVSLTVGNYLVSGQALTLLADRQSALTAGNYALSGQALAPLADRTVGLSVGSYALSGQSLDALMSRVLSLSTGGYALSGAQAALLAARLVSLAAGQYADGGVSASALVGRLLVSNAGSYLYTGLDADLIYTPIGSYLLNLAPGVYGLTGMGAALLAAQLLDLSTGSYAVSGQALSAFIARLLNLAAAAYTVTGADANLVYAPIGAYVLNMATGHYFWVGKALTMTAPSPVAAPHMHGPVRRELEEDEDELLILIAVAVKDD